MRPTSRASTVYRREMLRTTAGSLALGASSASAGSAAGQSQGLEPLGSVPVDGAREVVVGPSGETAYVAATDGFATVDVSDPTNPRVITERRDLLADEPYGPLDGIHDAKVAGDRLLVVGPAGSTDGDRGAALHFDVSDPTNPVQRGVYETAGLIHNGFLTSGVAFLCVIDEETNPLVTLDAETMTERGRWSLPAHDRRWRDVPAGVRPIHDVLVHQDLAYVALWDAGTWVLDVREPASPSVVTVIGGRPPDTLADLPTSTGTAFTELPGNHHQAVPNGDGTVLGIGKEAWDDPSTPKRGGPAGIALWDISELDSPKRLATLSPPPTPDPTREGVWTHAHNFDFAGDLLYTSWNRGGIEVLDVSDPSSPVEVASWRDSSGNGFFTGMRASFWSAQSVSEDFFVASTWVDHDGNGDARLFTFPDPSRETTSQATRTTETARTDRSTGRSPTATAGRNRSREDGTTEVDAPGFGVFAGLVGTGVGLGAIARRARRRRRNEGE